MSVHPLQRVMEELYGLCSGNLPLAEPVGRNPDLVARFARELTLDHEPIVACLKILGRAGIFAYRFNVAGKLTRIDKGPNFGASLPVLTAPARVPPLEAPRPRVPQIGSRPPYGLSDWGLRVFQLLCQYAGADGWSYKPAFYIVSWQYGLSVPNANYILRQLRYKGVLRSNIYGHVISVPARDALFPGLEYINGPAGPDDWHTHPGAVPALTRLRTHAHPHPGRYGWYEGSLSALLAESTNLRGRSFRDLMGLLRLRDLYFHTTKAAYWVDMKGSIQGGD